MESCENLDLDTLSDCDYVKHGFCMWINNEPSKAIEFLEKRKNVLSVEFGAVLLRFFNALISFDRCRINEASSLLRELERKCSPPEQGWFRSIKSKLFGIEQRELTCKKSILFELEREIILADVLLCSSILIGISCDVSSYIKSALIFRRSWKIYNQTIKEINELCNEYFDQDETTSMMNACLNNFNNNNDDNINTSHDLPSPTSSECSYYSVPSLIHHSAGHPIAISTNFTKSHSTVFPPTSTKNLSYEGTKFSKQIAMMNFSVKCERADVKDKFDNDCDISLSEFRLELQRLRGGIYFGFGALQLAFSLIPQNFYQLINFFGYQGDRDLGLNCLKEARNSQDMRSLMSTVALLYYYLIIVPFFSIENSDLSEEIATATEILNENERFDQSALFLFFSGRRQRLKKKMKFAIMHYDAALRVQGLPRELKMLLMHELGLCLLIELNFHDAMHYFNELKVSKFSKSFYIYLRTICRGAIEPNDESLKTTKEALVKIISVSPQKDGIIERFLLNRCNHAIPNEDQSAIYWRILCYEILYLWNILGSCSEISIRTIIDECKIANETSEPILGISQFLLGACYATLKDQESSIVHYKQCIKKCNENPSKVNLTYIPAYANYELASFFMKIANENSKDEARNLLHTAQMYKNYDFEHRLKLKIYSLKIS